jgi:hypothetical protein
MVEAFFIKQPVYNLENHLDLDVILPTSLISPKKLFPTTQDLSFPLLQQQILPKCCLAETYKFKIIWNTKA